MGFGMTPATGWPVPTDGDFPTFIQFQEDGVNLGGPDADTVNFTGNVSVTRGEGENANVITVDVAAAASGGGSTPEDDMLVAGATGFGSFNGSSVSSYSGSQALKFSDDVSWDESTATLTFSRRGVYAVTAKVKVSSSGEDVFPIRYVWFGVGMTNAENPTPTKHSCYGDATEDNSDRNQQCFTDTVYYSTVNGLSSQVLVYAQSAASPSTFLATELSLQVHYIGPEA